MRRATPADLPALLDFESRLYAEDGTIAFARGPAERALLELVHDERLGLVWFAECEGKAAGYLLLTWGFSIEFHGPIGIVDEVFVAPAERGRGLGASLFAAAEAAARARGVLALRLEVERTNPRAYDLYRRLGFEPQDRHLMSKRLRG